MPPPLTTDPGSAVGNIAFLICGGSAGASSPADAVASDCVCNRGNGDFIGTSFFAASEGGSLIASLPGDLFAGVEDTPMGLPFSGDWSAGLEAIFPTFISI